GVLHGRQAAQVEGRRLRGLPSYWGDPGDRTSRADPAQRQARRAPPRIAAHRAAAAHPRREAGARWPPLCHDRHDAGRHSAHRARELAARRGRLQAALSQSGALPADYGPGVIRVRQPGSIAKYALSLLLAAFSAASTARAAAQPAPVEPARVLGVVLYHDPRFGLFVQVGSETVQAVGVDGTPLTP